MAELYDKIMEFLTKILAFIESLQEKFAPVEDEESAEA